jgi:hypothetical protein
MPKLISLKTLRLAVSVLLLSLINFASPTQANAAAGDADTAYIENIEIYEGSGSGLTDTLTLTSTFDSTTTTILTDTVTQEVNVETVTIVVTPGVFSETITVNSVDYPVTGSDTVTVEVALIAGFDNQITLVVDGTSTYGGAGGSATSTYTLTIHRAVDKSLSNLSVSSGTLNFVRGTKTYSVSVGNDVADLTFTPTANVPDSVTAITVNGADSTTAVSLSVGANTVYIVSEGVTDAGQTPAITYETYTVTVNRAAASTPAPAPVYIPTTSQAALVLSSSATTVEWGSQAKLTLAGGSGTGNVTYSSTGTTFCAVDRDGNLTPVSVGTCTVTATKDGDGTYGSAQSNSITITAVDKAPASTTGGSSTASGLSMVVGKPVGGVATVKFTVADTYAGERVSVILATKNSAGRTIYKTLGSAKVGSTGAVTFKTKVKLPVGAVLQLKSAGTVIFSKSIK